MKEDRKIKNVKVVIWDCDDTIWFRREDEMQIMSKKFKIPITEELKQQYSKMFEAFFKNFADRKVKYEEIVRVIKENMPILSEYELSADKFFKKWLQVETSFLNEEALEVIKYLERNGYKNVILTDWLWVSQIILLEKYGILPYIDQVYTCDNQYLKSNPKSASRVIREGCEKDYVIIGDSLNSDIAFANHAGIKSIWYNPKGKENRTSFKPTVEISSMLEVCKIIS